MKNATMLDETIAEINDAKNNEFKKIRARIRSRNKYFYPFLGFLFLFLLIYSPWDLISDSEDHNSLALSLIFTFAAFVLGIRQFSEFPFINNIRVKFFNYCTQLAIFSWGYELKYTPEWSKKMHDTLKRHKPLSHNYERHSSSGVFFGKYKEHEFEFSTFLVNGGGSHNKIYNTKCEQYEGFILNIHVPTYGLKSKHGKSIKELNPELYSHLQYLIETRSVTHIMIHADHLSIIGQQFGQEQLSIEHDADFTPEFVEHWINRLLDTLRFFKPIMDKI